MTGAISVDWGENEFEGGILCTLKNKTARKAGGFDLTSLPDTFPAAQELS
jgi:hypothetical protein